MAIQRIKNSTGGQMLLLGFLSALAVAAARPFYSQPLSLHYRWSEHVERSAAEKGFNLVSLNDMRTMVETFSHILLDARKPSDFRTGHIPGAMSLPTSEFDRHFNDIAVLLSPEQPVLVYCSGQDCDESLLLGEMLKNAGYTNLYLFAGGMKAWEDAGLPVNR